MRAWLYNASLCVSECVCVYICMSRMCNQACWCLLPFFELQACTRPYPSAPISLSFVVLNSSFMEILRIDLLIEGSFACNGAMHSRQLREVRFIVQDIWGCENEGPKNLLEHRKWWKYTHRIECKIRCFWVAISRNTQNWSNLYIYKCATILCYLSCHWAMFELFPTWKLKDLHLVAAYL
jgi:hypothetical protein